jgi:hypothetical protein
MTDDERFAVLADAISLIESIMADAGLGTFAEHDKMRELAGKLRIAPAGSQAGYFACEQCGGTGVQS